MKDFVTMQLQNEILRKIRHVQDDLDAASLALLSGSAERDQGSAAWRSIYAAERGASKLVEKMMALRVWLIEEKELLAIAQGK